MNIRASFPQILASLCLLAWASSASGAVTVEPAGVGVAVEDGDVEEVVLTLVNQGQNEAGFTIDIDWIRPGRNPNEGPRRDDLGDRIAEVNPGAGWWTGLAWDGEFMWGYDHDSGRVIRLNPEDGEVEVVFNAGFQGTTGMTFDGENLWIAHRQTLQIVAFDREGNRVRAIQTEDDLVAIGIAWDGDGMWIGTLDQRLFLINRDGDIIREVGIAGLSDGWPSCTWVADHRDGGLWWRDHGRSIYQLNVDGDDNAEILQEWNANAGNDFGLAHDGENIWYVVDRDDAWYVIDDGIVDFSLITADPVAGEIDAEGDADILLTIDPTGYEPDVYDIQVIVRIDEPDARYQLRISAVVSIDSPTFDLVGHVIDAETEEPIEDAVFSMDQYLITRSTDGEGDFSVLDLPLGVYDITVSTPDYLPHRESIDVDEEGEFQLEIALLYAELVTEIDEINVELDQNEQGRVEFTATNEGNGPLTYTVETRVLDGELDPRDWELSESIPVGQIVDDSRIEGVAFTGDRYYVSGHAEEPTIYVLNRDGEQIDSYPQPLAGESYMRDLAWDGELIWGTAGRTIVGFTTWGGVRASFDGPYNPNTAIAYDPQNELLWICSTTSDLIAFDREGNQIGVLNRHGFRTYGLAYWEDDPDGYNLYIYHSPSGGRQVVHKMNVADSDTMFVQEISQEVSPGRPAGAFITREYDPLNWAFMLVANNGDGDRVDVWQLGVFTSWLTIEPDEGEIPAGEDERFTVTLSSTGLPEGELHGELVFRNDGRGGETTIAVTLIITGDPGNQPPGAFSLVYPSDGQQFQFEVDEHWNLIDSLVTFTWQRSFDPDEGVVVTYRFWYYTQFELMDGDSISWAVEDTFFTVPLYSLVADSLIGPFPPVRLHEWFVDAESSPHVVRSRERYSFSVVFPDAVHEDNLTPVSFGIHAAYPNPFNSSLTIAYGLQAPGFARLSVHDVAGRLLRMLWAGESPAGSHALVWNAESMPAGVYLLRLDTGGDRFIQKVALVR